MAIFNSYVSLPEGSRGYLLRIKTGKSHGRHDASHLLDSLQEGLPGIRCLLQWDTSTEQVVRNCFTSQDLDGFSL